MKTNIIFNDLPLVLNGSANSKFNGIVYFLADIFNSPYKDTLNCDLNYTFRTTFEMYFRGKNLRKKGCNAWKANSCKR